MNKVELEAWKTFVLVVKNFLGNNKAINYAELVNNMLTAFRNLGCNMSIKMHYLFSHMDRFPENLGSMSDEQRGEIPSGSERDGDQVSGSLGCSHDGWLLLESEERPPCRWAFQEFEKKRKFKPWSLNNGETRNLHVLTFINAHHSVYRN